jgi:hypothetical protein
MAHLYIQVPKIRIRTMVNISRIKVIIRISRTELLQYVERLEGIKWRSRIAVNRFVQKALFLDPSEDMSFPLIKSEGYNNVIHCALKLLNQR